MKHFDWNELREKPTEEQIDEMLWEEAERDREERYYEQADKELE